MAKQSSALKIKGMYYYGSDLNRFIDESCTHEMYCINIDCLLIKCSNHRIRFIESKHLNESIPTSEKSVFNILARLLHNIPQKEWIAEFFIIWGDYPFNTCFVASNWTPEKRYLLNQQQLKNWLDFRVELRDILLNKEVLA